MTINIPSSQGFGSSEQIHKSIATTAQHRVAATERGKVMVVMLASELGCLLICNRTADWDFPAVGPVPVFMISM